MGRELANDSWVGSWKRSTWKIAPETEREVIGVLAFEVASLMSNIVNLWHFLGDNEITNLKAEITNSVGIHRLVSEDDSHLMDLTLNEVMEKFGLISRAVGRLGTKCLDPVFAQFEHFVRDSIEWFGWDYRLKKMERKVKKMERFIAVTMQLSHEHEVLAKLEESFRRMQAGLDTDRVRITELQQKLLLQNQEVNKLRELSPWVRTYDYIVRLLARSLFTILERIKLVFEVNWSPSAGGHRDRFNHSPDRVDRSRSLSAAIYPYENILCGISSVAHGKSGARSGLADDCNNLDYKQLQLQYQQTFLLEKLPISKSKLSSPRGSFTGCIMSGGASPVVDRCNPVIGGSMRLNGDCLKMEKLGMLPFPSSNRIYLKLALFNSKPGLLKPPPKTLGHAALALHYANLIVMIEKLASSPHMIESEDRDQLYSMLPRTIRAALRKRLKPNTKSLGPSAHKPSIAPKWDMFLTRTLKWLSPLAHSMIRWQMERNIERSQEVSGAIVLLVQTLYFADQVKTEAVITDLLVGLNYIYWINKESMDKGSPEFGSCRISQCHLIKKA